MFFNISFNILFLRHNLFVSRKLRQKNSHPHEERIQTSYKGEITGSDRIPVDMEF